MFDNISLDKYDFLYELQRSQFFKDCLYPEIDFQLKDGSVSVYKQLDSGISEEISVDELIYFIHYEVAKYIYPRIDVRSINPNVETRFNGQFTGIICIRNAVENMKIILKYGEKEKEEVVEDGSSNEQMSPNKLVIKDLSGNINVKKSA